MADPFGKTIRAIAKYPGLLLSRTGITPNQLTVIGLIANIIVAFFIASGSLSYFAVGILIWLAGFFDALDGSVARHTGKTTVFGCFLDSVLDRYADAVIFLGILAYFMNMGHTGLVLLVALAMIGSFGVSYVRAKAESLGQKCEVGLMPRTVRILVLGAGFCVYQPFWAILIIAALSNLTVLQRILFVRNNLNTAS